MRTIGNEDAADRKRIICQSFIFSTRCKFDTVVVLLPGVEFQYILLLASFSITLLLLRQLTLAYFVRSHSCAEINYISNRHIEWSDNEKINRAHRNHKAHQPYSLSAECNVSCKSHNQMLLISLVPFYWIFTWTHFNASTLAISLSFNRKRI